MLTPLQEVWLAVQAAAAAERSMLMKSLKDLPAA